MISSELSIRLDEQKFPNFEAECCVSSRVAGRQWLSLKLDRQEVTIFGLPQTSR